MSTGRVLLAGVTGTLGQRLIPALASRGYAVIAVTRPRSEDRLVPLRRHLAGVRVAELTDPETLRGVCAGVDLVVSSVGITRQKGATYEQVDLGANASLLREAEAAGVDHFTYLSVVGADRPSGVPVLEAKHRFEQALAASPLSWTIIRPSGFFTDLLEVLAMARRGIVVQVGDGERQLTPIDVTDLAQLVAARATDHRAVTALGGPEDLSWNEIAALCFEAVGRRRGRIVRLPVWSLRALMAATRPVSRNLYGVLSFIGHTQTHGALAPRVGITTFREFLAGHTNGSLGRSNAN